MNNISIFSNFTIGDIYSQGICNYNINQQLLSKFLGFAIIIIFSAIYLKYLQIKSKDLDKLKEELKWFSAILLGIGLFMVGWWMDL